MPSVGRLSHHQPRTHLGLPLLGGGGSGRGPPEAITSACHAAGPAQAPWECREGTSCVAGEHSSGLSLSCTCGFRIAGSHVPVARSFRDPAVMLHT